MTVLKVYYFVTFVLVFWLASCIDASCEFQKGEIMKAGTSRIVNCETLYLCDRDSHLRVYPACIKSKCQTATMHRDLDTSKPWPQCCRRYTC